MFFKVLLTGYVLLLSLAVVAFVWKKKWLTTLTIILFQVVSILVLSDAFAHVRAVISDRRESGRLTQDFVDGLHSISDYYDLVKVVVYVGFLVVTILVVRGYQGKNTG